jgi:thiol-disulfide isomerase/thioredoxin
MTVKNKLEAVANVAVILTALAVGCVAIMRYVATQYVRHSVAAGDTLASIPGLEWNQHRRTLVLALNTGCHYCKDSVPLYQKLADAQRPKSRDLKLIAIFPNDPDSVREFSSRERIGVEGLAGVSFESMHLTVTPTVILVDERGRVQRSWVGVLTPRQELELLSIVSIDQNQQITKGAGDENSSYSP